MPSTWSYKRQRFRPMAAFTLSGYKRSVDVLVVDDAASIRSRLRTMFVDVRGVDSVREASSLEEARRLIAQKMPRAVVLDLQMRTESGLDLLRDLKSERANVLVIVLTNAATDHHRRSCALLGADYFFDKSRQFEAVLQVLEHEAGRLG